MHNFYELESKFQSVKLSKDKKGNDVMHIHTYPIAGKFAKPIQKIYAIIIYVLTMCFILKELKMLQKFPDFGMDELEVILFMILIFFIVLYVLYTDNHYQISSDEFIFKRLSFNRFVIRQNKLSLKNFEKFICECRYIYVNPQTRFIRRNKLEIVFKNNVKVDLHIPNTFKEGLAMLDLIQSFLGLEEKVMISKYHYVLYNKKFITVS